MPLTQIFDEISKQGHFLINTKGSLTKQRVTIQFGPLSLENGSKRILRKINYTTTYDQNGNVVSLSLFGSMLPPSSGAYTPPQAKLIVPVQTEPSEVIQPNEPKALENKETGKDADPMTEEKGPDSSAQPAESAPKQES